MFHKIEKEPTKIQKKEETIVTFILMFAVFVYGCFFWIGAMAIDKAAGFLAFISGGLIFSSIVVIINIFNQAIKKGYVERPSPK